MASTSSADDPRNDEPAEPAQIRAGHAEGGVTRPHQLPGGIDGPLKNPLQIQLGSSLSGCLRYLSQSGRPGQGLVSPRTLAPLFGIHFVATRLSDNQDRVGPGVSNSLANICIIQLTSDRRDLTLGAATIWFQGQAEVEGRSRSLSAVEPDAAAMTLDCKLA